jgi:predicted glycoside hydrolase/deacetylase ChbG (UPF0249 family)
MSEADAVLIITADDYGYAPGYNRGILEAADARAVDAVSAMVARRWCDPAPLIATGVEVGLHLELPGPDLEAQLARFEELFGRPPDYLDGHHHCHARPEVTDDVARTAAERALPVRSVDSGHRQRLRAAGAITQDLLIGRLRPSSPALPTPLAPDGVLPSGVTEWMVHPGYSDPEAGSSYDAAREEDLDLVLGISAELRRRVRRETHRHALTTQ